MSEPAERVGSEEGQRANPMSLLSSLKERRQEVLEQQILRLPVPRWDDPVIVVMYKPVDHSYIRLGQNRVEKANANKKAEVEMEGNIDVLVRGCAGVVAIVDGQEYSLRPDDPMGEPTLFDRDLAKNLGVEGSGGSGPTARQVVKALFITEGDILSAASELVRFSGYQEAEADSTILGE